MENIGTIFKQAREKLNLSLEDVSVKTKIRQHILKSIEDGETDFLPPIYAASFIKSYAGFLKIRNAEVTELINQLHESDKSYVKYTQPVIDNPLVPEKKDNKEFYKNLFKGKGKGKITRSNVISYIIYSALAIAVVTLLYFTFFLSDGGNLHNFPSEANNKHNKPDTAMIGEPSNNKNELANFYQGADSVIILEAKGKDTAWVRIVIDGNESEQIVMYPDNYRKWTAKKYFVLSVGNEGAIEFKRNGQMLKNFGTRGRAVRNVKITGTDVIIPSAPWNKEKVEKVEAPPPLLEPSNVKSSLPTQDKKK